MPQFFNGWRRKIGVMTLAMACVLMWGWARSHIVVDTFTFRSQSLAYFLNSACGHIEFETDSNPFMVKNDWNMFPSGWQTTKVDRTEPREWNFDDALDPLEVISRWRWCGFEFFRATRDRELMFYSVWRIPYWLIVAPLTLLSAYLLLSKPRPRKPPEAAKPPGEAQVTDV